MFYSLDVHRDFIQVCALAADGKTRREFQIDATAEAIEAFAKTLGRADAVVLEATPHTWAIHSIFARFVDRVVVANPLQVRAIAHAKIKTDKIDAHILAQLLRMDFLPEVELPSREAWVLRQLVAHRRQLVKQRTAAKNTIHAVLHRCLIPYPRHTLFTGKGMAWVKRIELASAERFILDSQVRLVGEIESRIEAVDEKLLHQSFVKRGVKLLLTIPGVNVTVAVGFLAAIDSIDRFETPQQLAAYFGLVPKIRQSAGTLRTGGITKAGSSSARWLAIEAAQCLSRSGSPLTASYHRLRRRRGHNVAVTALARKLTVVVWHLLKKGEPYRYAPVARTREKLKQIQRKPHDTRWRPAPKTLEQVYHRAGLELPPPTAGELRTAKNNRIALSKLVRTTSSD